MPLNAYLALACIAIVLLSPLILLTAPIWVTWMLMQRRGRRALGLRTLLPFMAHTAELYARAMIPGDPPGGDWFNVSRRIDAYIAGTRSPRIWRLKLLLIIMEITPLLRLRLPFSMMDARSRTQFVATLPRERGLLRITAMGRQLMRLAYYSDTDAQTRMGFVPMARRAAWRRKPERELASV
jgi:hypothetical protein